MPIYLDQASSSFPKPNSVADEVYKSIAFNAYSVNRSSNRYSYKLENIVYDTRLLLDKFFNGYGPENVVFSKNITESLNVVIKGLFNPGDHVLISPLEHNAVLRPLYYLSQHGITYSTFECDKDGTINLYSIKKNILANTKAVIVTHASNVCGSILPICDIAKICKENGLIFILDTAQTAGVIPIDMKNTGIDILCFTGHKSLLGPQGIGGFLSKKELYKKIRPLIYGGTGSISDKEDMPEFMPDKFEAGTINMPGICGLNASLKWIANTGIEKIFSHEQMLCQQFLEGIRDIKSIKIIGNKDMSDRLGLVSILSSKDNAELSQFLEQKDIITRVGLHCAPLAHKSLGTFPRGTIRFSFGYFNTLEDIDITIKAIKEFK